MPHAQTREMDVWVLKVFWSLVPLFVLFIPAVALDTGWHELVAHAADLRASMQG